jgi:hypothetical protein
MAGIKGKSGRKKKQPISIKDTRQLRYTFTKDELREQGRKLADQLEEADRLEKELKEIKSQFKAKLEAVGGQVAVLRNNISTGYELRNVDVEYQLDVPGKGWKRVLRLDTNETLGDEKLSASEVQVLLDLENEGKRKGEVVGESEAAK